MSECANHTFEFPADQIASAAAKEAVYHREREAHWRARAETALQVVESTISAKVVRHEVTGGDRVTVVVDYGDQKAWNEFQLADGKVRSHEAQAERFEVDARVYGTQGERPYWLDTDDVRHFRLGGEQREE